MSPTWQSKLLRRTHPNRAIYLNSLRKLLGRRFMRTGSMGDLNRALSYFKKSWACSSSAPSIRISSAQFAAIILTTQLNWEDSSVLLQGAVELLPFVSVRSLEHTDKQHMLAQFTGLASAAAAAALKAGESASQALRLLELGRDIIAGLLMEMRGDITDLKEQYPHLADEFIHLREELDSPRFEELIKEIRTQPKFCNFLLPPSAEEMMAAAKPDPIIVINMSAHRSEPLHISKLLEWLWNVVSRPSLEALGFANAPKDDFPRVWWIPTGPLSHLPLHAAGRHMDGSSETVLDRTMSSYASSIKALIYGHRRHRSIQSQSDHAVLVAMQETPGLAASQTLPYAAVEVENLKKFCPELGLKPISPSLCKADVLDCLRQCQIFHFAGHGLSHPTEPSRSCLLLEDWESKPLRVGDLRDLNLQKNPPFLAYLSPCSTGANEVYTLVDEGIHLVSVF
ncbi:hypothetical protein CPC735_017210 [Coccidioides posadasii C735 delta SOWgp]|uniref:CHAT domain-containing protein n=1 Tax=Coccidioides posadasii (strain C735) TaxID=222929 RepID=C5PDF8_COCP7|nr:hypothetical protein CPC735_017210 [Coccidioides posadasii C735 delta SOWgp]EER25119.1 hypothetical protein CPC735_017210 [Coccidioides posadasii C735 delta SOWgp]|eukprot:XP_003067264.1 hypothetical protein CPC735_017210 [Coccidioides posadasii C735 delta SOWgp]